MMIVVDTSPLLPRRTTADTGKLWPELARRTLLLPVILAVATGRTVGTLTATGTTHLSRTRWTDGPFVGRGDNLRRKVQPDA